MSRKKKNAAQQRQTSRELIDIQKITEYGLLTSHGELVFRGSSLTLMPDIHSQLPN